MLSIGGDQEFKQSALKTPDPWTKGLGIFDMTTLSWTNAYDAAAPAYEQPSLVSQFYVNNSRYPISWGDPELQSIFTTPNGIANVSRGSNGGSHSSNGGNNGSNSGDNNTSSITITSRVVDGAVGGVIGSIAVLAIISLLIQRRYKRKGKQNRGLAELSGLGIDVTRYEAPDTSIPRIYELPA